MPKLLPKAKDDILLTPPLSWIKRITCKVSIRSSNPLKHSYIKIESDVLCKADWIFIKIFFWVYKFKSRILLPIYLQGLF